MPERSCWLPCALRRDDDRWWVDECDVGAAALDQPFFDQSVRTAVQRDRRAMRTLPLEDVLRSSEVAAPVVLVFHVSRCGSTLLTQMLAAVDRFGVFSEPEVLDAVLRAPLAEATKIAALRGIINTYAAAGRVAIVKLSARAIHQRALLDAALPQARRILVYRDPPAVLASLLSSSSERLPPGLIDAGLIDDGRPVAASIGAVEFWSRVLASQFSAAVALCDAVRPPLLVDYGQLPNAVWHNVASYCDVELDEDSVERMRVVSVRDAKHPQRIFMRTSVHGEAGPSIQAPASIHHTLRRCFERLEAERLRQRSNAT